MFSHTERVKLFAGRFDSTVFLFESLHRIREHVGQQLRIDRPGDHAAVELHSVVFTMVLSKIEDELRGVVAHLEVICITCLEGPPPKSIVAAAYSCCHMLVVSASATSEGLIAIGKPKPPALAKVIKNGRYPASRPLRFVDM